jgi:hypothetical protein
MRWKTKMHSPANLSCSEMHQISIKKLTPEAKIFFIAYLEHVNLSNTFYSRAKSISARAYLRFSANNFTAICDHKGGAITGASSCTLTIAQIAIN